MLLNSQMKQHRILKMQQWKKRKAVAKKLVTGFGIIQFKKVA